MRRFNSSHTAIALLAFCCMTAYSLSLLLHPAEAQASEETPVMQILKPLPPDEDEQPDESQEWRWACSPEDAQAVHGYFNPTIVRPHISDCRANCQAASIPSPEYPGLAKAARVSGAVEVSVLVDETGRVIYSRAVSGHPLLTATAARAACQARFIPPTVSGASVKVAGIITYNFVLE